MKCLSLDHKKADVAIRRRVAFSSVQRAEIMKSLPQGAIALVTCNRTELYYRGNREDGEVALQAFARDCPFVFYDEEEAEKHLFRLAAGLCSMLVGEDEILGQIRDAYGEARSLGSSRGLDAAFQSALSCGKRVREQTKISSFACSLATLAANEVFRFKPEGARVLLVGATGKIGSSVLKNLLACGACVTATSRRHGRRAEAAGAAAAPYEMRYDLLKEADAVISCTASRHTVFALEKTAEACKDGKNRLFIDLSVPPDIDEGVGSLAGCRLLGIDGFRAAAEENNAKKRAAAAEAESVVSVCLAEYFAGEYARRRAPFMKALSEEEKKKLYALRKRDPAAFCEYMRRAEEEE